MSRSRRRYAVPGSERGMQAFKAEVMKQEGFRVNPDRPDDVKYEVAQELGVVLRTDGEHGDLTPEEAGQVGGRIGGSMVRELVRMAQEQLAEQKQKP